MSMEWCNKCGNPHPTCSCSETMEVPIELEGLIGPLLVPRLDCPPEAEADYLKSDLKAMITKLLAMKESPLVKQSSDQYIHLCDGIEKLEMAVESWK